MYIYELHFSLFSMIEAINRFIIRIYFISQLSKPSTTICKYFFYLPFPPLFVKRIKLPIVVEHLLYNISFSINSFTHIPRFFFSFTSYLSTLPLPTRSCTKKSKSKFVLCNFFCFSSYFFLHTFLLEKHILKKV